MRKFAFILLGLLIFITSCADMNKSEDNHMLIFSGTTVDYTIPLPFFENFETDTFNYVQDLMPRHRWEIINIDGNNVLKCVLIDERIELPPGNPIFHLMIGDKEWRNYAFSFDFFIPEGSWIIFAPFADTNADNFTMSYLGSRNPWSLRLDYTGVLLYQTVLGHNTHYIGELSNVRDSVGNQKTKPIEGFSAGAWNSVELIPVDLELHMLINNINIGKVAEIFTGISGRISIGGGVGSMFDNLRVEEIR